MSAEVSKLIQNIKDGVNVDEEENKLSKHIKEIAESEEFFSLPTENVLNVIEKSKIDDIDLICKLTKTMSEFKKDEAPLILNVINSNEVSRQNLLSIIANLTKCPLSQIILNNQEKIKKIPTNAERLKHIEEFGKIFESDIYKAIENDDFDSVQFIMKEHREKTKYQKDGHDILYHALKLNKTRIAEYLIDMREQCKGEHIAIAKDERIVELLIKNYSEKREKTPLFDVQTGRAVDFLAKNGSDVNEKEEHGYTPIFYAKNESVAEELLKNGADLSVRSNINNTPLHIAAKLNHVETIKFFLKKGIKPDEKNKFGDTPLHMAASKEVAKALISGVTNVRKYVNTKNEKGDIPLHFASYRGDIKFAKILLNNGANINEKNAKGETPIKLAEMNFQFDIYEFLESRGAYL